MENGPTCCKQIKSYHHHHHHHHHHQQHNRNLCLKNPSYEAVGITGVLIFSYVILYLAVSEFRNEKLWQTTFVHSLQLVSVILLVLILRSVTYSSLLIHGECLTFLW